MKGKGNSVSYKYRMHDPRIGRFFAVDPLAKTYPWNSPYAFSENKVIHAVELEGLESEVIILRNVPTTAALSAGTGNQTFSPSGFQWVDIVSTQAIDNTTNIPIDLSMSNVDMVNAITIGATTVGAGARTSTPTNVLTIRKNINDVNIGMMNSPSRPPAAQTALNVPVDSNPITPIDRYNVTDAAGNPVFESTPIPTTATVQNQFVRYYSGNRNTGAGGGATNPAVRTTTNGTNTAQTYINDVNALNQNGNLSNTIVNLRFPNAVADNYSNAIVNTLQNQGYTVNTTLGARMPANLYVQIEIILTPATQNTGTGDSNAGRTRR